MQYTEAQIYGLNIIIKEYAKFPKILPLPCHMEHGWTPAVDAEPGDLAIEKPLMLVFSERRALAWKRKSAVPVVVISAPFVCFRNMRHITKKDDAKGTVVFPSHSTLSLDSKFDIKSFCNELKALPKEFHPITICLFWFDYIKESADIYREAGFSVVTAGSKINNSLDFVKNYYKILSSHNYAASNEVGSYTFYAVEMDIPFFLVGKTPVLEMKKGKKDPNVPEKYKITDFGLGKPATTLFSTGPVKVISKDQKEFVLKEIGKKDGLSSRDLNKILWEYSKKDLFLIKAFSVYSAYSLLSKIGLGKAVVEFKSRIFGQK
jgi:hypothetical protein